MLRRISFILWLTAGTLSEAQAQFDFNDAVMGYAYSSGAGTLQFDHIYSRAGDDIVSLHPSTGVYTVRFFGVVPQGTFIPMAAWAGEGACTIAGWGSDFDLIGGIYHFHRWGTMHCFNESGSSLNRWNQLMLVDKGSAGDDNPYLAFADSQQALPAGGFLDLSSGSTHNPGGGTTTLTRLGTGQYNLSFNGLGAVMPAGSTVQVIPVSPGNARSCRVDDWTLHFAGSDNARVRIVCYATQGSGLVDTRFIALVSSTEPSNASAASATVSGLNQPSSWTTLSGNNVHNPHGQIQVRWDAASLGGMHQLRFEWPSDTQLGVAFASPISSALYGCSSSSAHRPTGEPEGYLYVNVVCRDHTGGNSAAAFNVMVTQVTPELPDALFSDRFEP